MKPVRNQPSVPAQFVSSTNRYSLPLVDIAAGSVSTATNVSAAYRQLLAIALKHDLAPRRVDTRGLPRQQLFLPPNMVARIGDASTKYRFDSMQSTFAGLCEAASNYLRKQHKTEDRRATKAGVEPPFACRDVGQRSYFNSLMDGLANKKIVLAEASTGLGKGRCLMGAAILQSRNKVRPIYIAAPTLQVLDQLYAEYQEIVLARPELEVTIVQLPGRTEFVADDVLKAYLEESTLDPQVSEWVGRGGPALRDTPLIRMMRRNGIEPGWFLDDLRDISTNLAVDFFSLANHPTSEGEAASILSELCKHIAVGEADVVLMTHAMLCRRSGSWEGIAPPAMLIVDEAHLLEQAMSQAHSMQFSPYGLQLILRRHRKSMGIGKASAAGKADAALRRFIEAAKRLVPDGQEIRVDRQSDDTVVTLLIELEEIRKQLATRDLRDLSELNDSRMAINAAINILDGEASDAMGLLLRFSPDWRYPSLMSGPTSVGRYLGGLWKTCEAGAVLASATLYLPDAHGNMKGDYVRELLALPLSRLHTPKPVEARYVYALPTLQTPRRDRLVALTPPSRKDAPTDTHYGAMENAWLDAVGEDIAKHVAPSAAGGTVLLCTAYTQISALQRVLVAKGVEADRIVAQQAESKFAVTCQKHIALHRQGRRPVTLALGAAWTGLNLADQAARTPGEDLLLTDLVVVRSPIGLNRSTSMRRRYENTGTFPVIQEALLTLKQGLGRLIRRDGVQHRRLWVMDGRIWQDKWPGMQHFGVSARHMLDKYPRRESF